MEQKQSRASAEHAQVLKQMAVAWSAEQCKSEVCRQLYQSMLQCSPSSEGVFQACLDFETAHLPASYTELHGLYEAALSEHGEDSTELWLAYTKLELEQGHFKEANSLHWRAMKTLADPTEFAAQYDLSK